MASGLHAEGVKSCDGRGLREALLAATAWLGQHADRINALNVFPVPDGDTGSNMWLTLQSAVSESNGMSADAGAGRVAHSASHGALMGARGNSGVILSQVLRGIARSLDDKKVFGAKELAAALAEGSTTAYKGVIKPVEGTILTVAREAADAAREAADGGSDLLSTLALTVAAAQESVARTPDLLPVLAETGVVDAGGQGYLVFLEGMLRYFRGDSETTADEPGALQEVGTVVETEYGYCTEFMVMGQNLDLEGLRGEVLPHGDSALVVGEPDLVRVHIHTFDPGLVLSVALKYGTLHRIKIDNMQEQHHEYVLFNRQEIARSIAKAAPQSAPPAPPVGDVALVAVAAGVGLTNVFHSLGTTIVVQGGQTMNPSTGELLQAVESAPAGSVILLPNNSNIVLTAQQVTAITHKRLVVVPTRTMAQGVAALMAFNYEADLDANARSMKQAAGRVRTVEVTKAVRSARIDGMQVEAGAAIALADDKLVATGGNLTDVALDALSLAGAQEAELITIYHGDTASGEDAAGLAGQIERRWPGCTVEVVDGGQPHYPYIISIE
ncbi:MAG: DAK2 domain-containing protein [Chloroflexota bacterium]